MARRIVVHAFGGPEVLRLESYEPPAPGPGEVRVRHRAIGLNFIDVYFRTGLYPPPDGLPFTPGLEASGVVEAVGEGVSEFRPGQRVAYGTGPLGAYSDLRTMPADKLVAIPDEISDEVAAAMMLKGMTARYLLKQTYAVKPGDTILVHAAAGGVGLILCQWAKHLGATVIGTVGSREKAEIARAHGCDHPIVYTEEDFVARVKEITGGAGLPVVYDGVGRATFLKSLDCLRPRGLMVSFGNASGPVENFNLGILSQKGSLYVTRPTLFHYTATREELLACANDVIEVVRDGVVRIEVNQRFPLDEAAEAHRALESRRTTGATVLLP
ncbi:MAG TPA: quinone oxidoreductase [Rhodospirillales bacterium]|nr:quinone oxidoreductase [Rhodospirillales bacterium]